MYKAMLEMMVKQAETALAEKESPGWLWMREWGNLFLRAYEPDRKVVYTAVYAFPMELLWAFNVVPFDFEIACNLLPEATGGRGSSIMIEAEKQGFSRDICSFYRLALGAHLKGIVPKGDLYLTSSYYCNGKAKTNEIIARGQGKESIVPTHAYVGSGVKLSAPLADNDAAGFDLLTAIGLDPEKLGVTVPPVAC